MAPHSGNVTGDSGAGTCDPDGPQTCDGTAALNLRNLGEARTLVLVNGRRHIASRAGTAVVDINTIPTALVERVEVLTGGASAIYGADGVSGVVNFIMRDDFEGMDFRVQSSIPDDSGGKNYLAQCHHWHQFRGQPRQYRPQCRVFSPRLFIEHSTGDDSGSAGIDQGGSTLLMILDAKDFIARRPRTIQTCLTESSLRGTRLFP